MDKNSICQLTINNIINANQMELVSYDSETRERKSEFFEVTDSARQSAVAAIEQFQNSNSTRELIYHGQDAVADYLYYIEIRDGKLSLVVETDTGMRFHHVYDKPEEILYRFDELERIKSNLENVYSSHKK